MDLDHFRKASGDLVERSRVDPHLVPVGMDLRADSVVFVVGEGIRPEGSTILSGFSSGWASMNPSGWKSSHGGLVERVGSGQQCRCAQIAREHVCAADLGQLSSERPRDGPLDKSLLQADAKLALQDLRDEARTFAVQLSEQVLEDLALA